MMVKKAVKRPLYPLSDHYDGKRFYNLNGTRADKTFLDVVRFLYARRKRRRWPETMTGNVTPRLAKALTPDQAYVTYVNHACHLIQLSGLNILTDPIFSKRAGPFSVLGPKRTRHPGMTIDALPDIQVVVISHNHYDHLDMKTLRKLEKLFCPVFVVPLGNKTYLRKFRHVVELDWWQTYHHSTTHSVTLVPAQHWSMRKPWDANKALWGGFWIKSHELKIFFAGDTGYGPHFSDIQHRLGKPDISILPIGAYQPRWFMQNQHMNPEDAVLAAIDLQTQISIATHYLTFSLALEHVEEPLADLRHALIKHAVSINKFLAPQNGETIIYIKKLTG